MPISTVECCDCMDFMAKFPDKFFDLAIVDPPYGIGETWIKKREGKKDFKGLYKNESPPDENYFKQLKRCSKNQIIWGANFFPYVWPTKNVIIWDKVCTWEKDHKAECEIAITSLNHRPISIYRQDWSGGRKGSETGISIIHPHQKPINLYRWLLQNYAKPGDKILDTHLGSQSSRIAAYQMGFDFWGCEIDPEYFEQGCKRFEKEAEQLALFIPETTTEEQNKLFKEATS